MPNTIRANKTARRKPLADAHAGEAEALALKRKEAFELRAKRFTFREIADRLGVSVSTAFGYIEEYWPQINEGTKERAEVARLFDLEDLDRMERRWMPLVLADELDISTDIITGQDKDGEPIIKHIEIATFDAGTKALDRVLKIKERRAKLLGLDAPVETKDVTDPETIAELEARVAEAAKRRESRQAQLQPEPGADRTP